MIMAHSKHKKNMLHSKKKKKCLITPLSPHNGRLSVTATFFCPQGDCCGEVGQNYRVDSYFFYLENAFHDVTSAILVSQNNETAAMLVS